MNEPRRARARVTRWAWLLLASVPLAAGASFFLTFGIVLAWCGVSGCSGGGFGRTSDPDEVLAFTAAGLAALVWFAALAAPPWIRPARVRLTIAGIAAVIIAALLLAYGTGGFVSG